MKQKKTLLVHVITNFLYLLHLPSNSPRCYDSNSVTPDLERLRLVGGSKSSLQLVLVTPQTAGVEDWSLTVITA